MIKEENLRRVLTEIERLADDVENERLVPGKGATYLRTFKMALYEVVPENAEPCCVLGHLWSRLGVLDKPGGTQHLTPMLIALDVPAEQRSEYPFTDEFQCVTEELWRENDQRADPVGRGKRIATSLRKYSAVVLEQFAGPSGD